MFSFVFVSVKLTETALNTDTPKRISWSGCHCVSGGGDLSSYVHLHIARDLLLNVFQTDAKFSLLFPTLGNWDFHPFLQRLLL